MFKFSKYLTISTFVIFLFPTSFSNAKSLTGAELKAAVSGKRVDWVTGSGVKGYTKYKKNGTASVVIKSPKDAKGKDKGKWRIKGNQICHTWTVIRGGKEGCFSLSGTDNPKVLVGASGAKWKIR